MGFEAFVFPVASLKVQYQAVPRVTSLRSAMLERCEVREIARHIGIRRAQ